MNVFEEKNRLQTGTTRFRAGSSDTFRQQAAAKLANSTFRKATPCASPLVEIAVRSGTLRESWSSPSRKEALSPSGHLSYSHPTSTPPHITSRLVYTRHTYQTHRQTTHDTQHEHTDTHLDHIDERSVGATASNLQLQPTYHFVSAQIPSPFSIAHIAYVRMHRIHAGRPSHPHRKEFQGCYWTDCRSVDRIRS